MNTEKELELKIQELTELKKTKGLMIVQEGMLIAYEDSLNIVKTLNIHNVIAPLVCDDKELDCPYDFTSRCTIGRCDCKLNN